MLVERAVYRCGYCHGVFDEMNLCSHCGTDLSRLTIHDFSTDEIIEKRKRSLPWPLPPRARPISPPTVPCADET
jgi:hypothetical protein